MRAAGLGVMMGPGRSQIDVVQSRAHGEHPGEDEQRVHEGRPVVEAVEQEQLSRSTMPAVLTCTNVHALPSQEGWKMRCPSVRFTITTLVMMMASRESRITVSHTGMRR
jgi:hypothetical protein